MKPVIQLLGLMLVGFGAALCAPLDDDAVTALEEWIP